jgi:hypothetical protein
MMIGEPSGASGEDARAIAVRHTVTTTRSLARELARDYLIWDAFVGGRPRVDVHPLVLSASLHRRAIAVAEGAVRVLGGAVAGRAFADEDERSRYGLGRDVERLAHASRAAGDGAALVRVDLLLDREHAWRVCEINADCPGGHNEAHGLPRLARACGFREASDPTTVVDSLCARLISLAAGDAVALTFLTAYAEDLQICAFLKRALEARGQAAHLTPITALKSSGGHVYVNGQPIGVLYRYYPTEYMDGLAAVPALAEAVASGRLRTLSSFAQMYLQSKMVLARGWAARAALPREDAGLVEGSVAESHDLADVAIATLRAERARWVLKRSLGRVGDEVVVGPLCDDEEWSAIVGAIEGRRRLGERWIAQRFVEQAAVPTPWGPRLVTLGAYVLDGKFVGYFARLTEVSHVSHDALVLPVFAELDRRAEPREATCSSPGFAGHGGPVDR